MHAFAKLLRIAWKGGSGFAPGGPGNSLRTSAIRGLKYGPRKYSNNLVGQYHRFIKHRLGIAAVLARPVAAIKKYALEHLSFDRLLQDQDLRKPAIDTFDSISGHKNKWHAPSPYRIGDGVKHFSINVDVENRRRMSSHVTGAIASATLPNGPITSKPSSVSMSRIIIPVSASSSTSRSRFPAMTFRSAAPLSSSVVQRPEIRFPAVSSFHRGESTW